MGRVVHFQDAADSKEPRHMPFNELEDADDCNYSSHHVKEDGHDHPHKSAMTLFSPIPNNPSYDGETEAAEYPTPPRQVGRVDAKHAGNDITE